MVTDEEFKDMKKDVSDCASKIEFNIMNSDVLNIKNSFSKFLRADEFMARINIINSEVNAKLNDRPTSAELNKIVK